MQGSQIERDVYLRPPLEADQPKTLWKLKTCVYGLSDASRSWYVRVRDEFEKFKVKTSIYDHASFFWHENLILQGIIASHVDDFIFGGSKMFLSKVINPLKEIFCISHEEAIMFKYTDLHIKQCLSEIQVDQRGYVENIKPIALGKRRSTRKCDDFIIKMREKNFGRFVASSIGFQETLDQKRHITHVS